MKAMKANKRESTVTGRTFYVRRDGIQQGGKLEDERVLPPDVFDFLDNDVGGLGFKSASGEQCRCC